MAIVVKKFGGTSVGDTDKIHAVAALVKSHIERTGDQIVVVVSAMAGETSRLTKLAKTCVESPDPRELDVLLATGEQVTTSLLSMSLIEKGLKAKSFSAVQAHIATNGRHTNALIHQIERSAIMDTLSQGAVPVIAGFQGVDEKGDITTLGRGGSDITAVAVAAALKAKRCYIYTDVEGVYSADPGICRNAKILNRVSHEEMLELSSLGARVLHPRAVYFGMAYRVPVTVLSTFVKGHGTQIVEEDDLMEKPVITGITYRTDEAKITVSKLPAHTDSFSRLFKALAEEDIFVDMITQTGYDEKLTDISFTVSDEVSTRALESARRYAPELGAQGVNLDRDVAKVSVVGIGMKFHTGVAAKLFDALACESIPVEMISTSEIKVSVVIPMKYVEIAVRTLHERFCEDGAEVSEEKDSLH